MAIDTLMAYVGVYENVADAEADYDVVKQLHVEAGLIDAYDAAIVERRADGKVKLGKKHETPTRVGGVLGGGVGLATGLVVALFPFAAVGGGLLLGTTAGGAILGAVAGHAAAGMSRSVLGELGEHLDARAGGPRRGRGLRHGREGGACDEARGKGPGEAAQGRHRGDRARRQGGRRERLSAASPRPRRRPRPRARACGADRRSSACCPPRSRRSRTGAKGRAGRGRRNWDAFVDPALEHVTALELRALGGRRALVLTSFEPFVTKRSGSNVPERSSSNSRK